MTRRLLFPVYCVLALASVGAGAPAFAEECLTDWGIAGEIVRRQKLLTVQQLSQSNAAGLPGQIVKTTLCKDGDDYVYKVVVRQASGQLKTIVVDARSPGATGVVPAAAGAAANSR
jgi:hypothetical protein